MNYNDELKTLTTKLFEELKVAIPSVLKSLSYLIQTLLCAGAVVAIALFGLLNRAADEMEKNGEKHPPAKKKDNKQPLDIPVTVSEKCAFGITKYCVPTCHYWVTTLTGGYCKKYVEKKRGW